jgi:hypothetical protein
MNPCKNCGGQRLQKQSKNHAQYGSATFSASFVSRLRKGSFYVASLIGSISSQRPPRCEVKENGFANKTHDSQGLTQIKK